MVFPAESYAEKEGTVTHPDGRLQRVRQAIAHPAEVRSGWCGARGAVARGSASRCRCPRCPASSTSWRRRCRSTAGSRSRRSAAAACAGRTASRPPRSRPSPLPDTAARDAAGAARRGPAARHGAVALVGPRDAARGRAPLPRARADARDLARGRPAPRRALGRRGERVRGRPQRARTRAGSRSPCRRAACSCVEGTETDNATALMNGLPRTVEVTKA